MRLLLTDFRALRATSIKCSDENARRVWRALTKFGAPLSDLSPGDLTTPGIVIQLGTAPRRIDILTEITGVDFITAQSHQLIVSLEGLEIPVIGRSHLIQNKRVLGRPQDQADVARLEGVDSP
ncbi:MAG: hypothetical protein QOK48_250 [Blastocatellia bacterium]|jgi:hypothetical protein|nr:hypothetical protein [Blastocatellia bacterium]